MDRPLTDPSLPANPPAPENSAPDSATPAPSPSALPAPLRRGRPFVLAFLALLLLGGVGYLVYRMPLDDWGHVIHYSEHLDIYHSKGVSEDEVEELGRFLLACHIGDSPPSVTVRLDQRKDGYALYIFPPSPDALSDPDTLTRLGIIRDTLSSKVFDGRHVTLLLCKKLVRKRGLKALAEPEVLKKID